MLRAVGAGGVVGGREATGTGWSFLKVWVALETRQFLTATVHDVEKMVRYDLLSPNI